MSHQLCLSLSSNNTSPDRDFGTVVYNDIYQRLGLPIIYKSLYANLEFSEFESVMDAFIKTGVHSISFSSPYKSLAYRYLKRRELKHKTELIGFDSEIERSKCVNRITHKSQSNIQTLWGSNHDSPVFNSIFRGEKICELSNVTFVIIGTGDICQCVLSELSIIENERLDKGEKSLVRKIHIISRGKVSLKIKRLHFFCENYPEIIDKIHVTSVEDFSEIAKSIDSSVCLFNCSPTIFDDRKLREHGIDELKDIHLCLDMPRRGLLISEMKKLGVTCDHDVSGIDFYKMQVYSQVMMTFWDNRHLIKSTHIPYTQTQVRQLVFSVIDSFLEKLTT